MLNKWHDWPMGCRIIKGDLRMNFTNHKKLTDEEFKENYEKLFDACPRPSEYKTDGYWKKVRE